jgi:hypothetical protein
MLVITTWRESLTWNQECTNPSRTGRPSDQWLTEVGGVQTPPPRNSEVLTKLSRIPSSVENTSVTTLDIPKFWQSRTRLQIERNPWLGGYRPQIPVPSAHCPQLNLLNPPPPPPKKIPGYATCRRLNFVKWSLIFLGPQYGTFFISHFWLLGFWGCF